MRIDAVVSWQLDGPSAQMKEKDVATGGKENMVIVSLHSQVSRATLI